MVGAPGAAYVVDDYVLVADLDRSVASGAAIELGGDAANQPGLVSLGVQGTEAVPGVGKLSHVEKTP